jgi:hypothetical protein
MTSVPFTPTTLLVDSQGIIALPITKPQPKPTPLSSKKPSTKHPLINPSTIQEQNINKRQKTLLDYVCLSDQKTPIIYETQLDSRYWIKKPILNDDGSSDESSWKVMAIPTKKGFFGEDIEPYPVYEETPTLVGLPRFYGIEKYGQPKQNFLTYGEPMHPDVKFTWELKNTPQKPQKDAVNAWIKNKHQGMLVLGCGSGKTIIAIYLAVLMGVKTLILTHNEGLIYQWVERIEVCCPNARIGIIRQKKKEIENNDFVIGMIQTVRKLDYDLDTFGMLIVDECHHIAARTFSQAVLKTKCHYVLGLSATPERKDGLSYIMHWLLGPIVFKAERKDITPQKIYQIEYNEGNQKVIRYKNGILGVPTMITKMTEDGKRNTLIDVCLKKLIETFGITKILLVSDRREHLIQMNDYYKDKYDCGLYIGQLKKNDLEMAKKKKVIFASYGMANEFLDIPGLNGLILSTPASGNLEQIVGRLREKCNTYETCQDENEDVEYEEELDFAFQKLNIGDELVDCIKSYIKESKNRIVLDIIDPFDIFDGMAWKRFNSYRKLNYLVKRMKYDEFINIKQLDNYM